MYKIFNIMGQYQTEEPELIDTADSQEEAEYLKSEYELAYGAGWRVWIEEEV